MDAHPADPKGLGDGCWPLPRLAHLSCLGNGRRGFTAFVDALLLGCFDARLLALADEATLHLGHHTEHRHEDRPRRVLGREGGLQPRQSRAFGLPPPRNGFGVPSLAAGSGNEMRSADPFGEPRAAADQQGEGPQSEKGDVHGRLPCIGMSNRLFRIASVASNPLEKHDLASEPYRQTMTRRTIQPWSSLHSLFRVLEQTGS